MANHWGQLPPREELSEETADELIEKAMKPLPLRLYQPCDDMEEEGTVELPAECSTMDDTILHTIKLLQYEKTVQEYMEKFKSKGNKVNLNAEQPPAFPENLDKKPCHIISHPFRHIPREFTPFVEGIGSPPPRLSDTNAKKILQKSVATLFAHMGFDNTTKEILSIMTDIAEEYFIKFTNLLSFAVEQESLCGGTGFPDVVERVFCEMGIGSVLTLHEFYQQRVLLYHERMLKICSKLAEECSSHFTPVIKEELADVKTNIKEEGEEEVPLLHFPATGDGCSVDELPHSLGPGFQMLHSLEQGEHLQGMEAEEEVTAK